MPYVNLQLPSDQLKLTSEMSRHFGMKRAAYIREALDHFNKNMNRKLLSEQYKQASAVCRKDSLQTCREFEVADFRLEELETDD